VPENSDILESVVYFMVRGKKAASGKLHATRELGVRLAVKNEWLAGTLLATRHLYQFFR